MWTWISASVMRRGGAIVIEVEFMKYEWVPPLCIVRRRVDMNKRALSSVLTDSGRSKCARTSKSTV